MAILVKYFVFSVILLQLLVSGIIQRSEGHEESQLNASKRSKRWDDYIQSLKDAHEERRVRRQAGAHEWESNRCYCNPAEYTRYDALGRRDSGLLAEPQNQGGCGSCWAFVGAHTVSDQLSLSQGSRQPLLSANHLTLCNKYFGLIDNENGCCGGLLVAGPFYFWSNGAVSDECSPYDVTFDSSFNKETDRLPTCPSICSDGTPLNLASFRNRFIFTMPRTDQDIMDALDTGRMVIARMRLTVEFSRYECGVYHDSGTSKHRGYHAVEIVDYGITPSGTKFWVVKNSWGTSGQENGYFRIAWGQLEIANGFGSAIVLSIVAESSSTVTVDPQPIVHSHLVCTAEPVTNPSSNEMVMSAEEFARQQLFSINQVSCRNNDGGRATGLTFNSIISAKFQVVAGTNVEVQFAATVTGCEQMTVVDITADVFIDLDGAFTLEKHCISTQSINSAKTTRSLFWPVLLFAAAAVAILGAAV